MTHNADFIGLVWVVKLWGAIGNVTNTGYTVTLPISLVNSTAAQLFVTAHCNDSYRYAAGYIIDNQSIGIFVNVAENTRVNWLIIDF